MPVQGQAAPSLRSGVDMDEASLEVGRKRKRTGDHNGKRTRLCQRNEDRLFRIPRDDEPHRPNPNREERGQESPDQPDYRVFAGDIETEIGGGWVVQAKSSGREYISVTLADPQIGPRKIYANLAPVKGKKGRFVLLWNAKE